MHVRKSVQITKSATAVGIASLLFLTGCAASTPSPVATDTAVPSASATATATETASAKPEIELDPTVTAGMTPEQLEKHKEEVAKLQAMTPEELAAYGEANNGPFSSRLVSAQSVKAGSSIRVTGGTYEPGVSVQIYVAQLMAMPSYDAANDMYHQVGEQIHLTETVTATTNEKGQFEIQILIPAGTAPQPVDVISSTTDGRGDLVRTEIR